MKKKPRVNKNKKLEELILYISQKSATDSNSGATKLCKILYFADFLHYAYFGQSITGEDYQKLPHGPAPRMLVPVRERMQERRDLAVQVMSAGRFSRERPVNLRDPDLDIFSGKEIAFVDEVIAMLAKRNATEASELSHRLSVGWKIAGLKETIPYASVFLTDNIHLTDADIARGRELAEEYSLFEPAALRTIRQEPKFDEQLEALAISHQRL